MTRKNMECVDGLLLATYGKVQEERDELKSELFTL